MEERTSHDPAMVLIRLHPGGRLRRPLLHGARQRGAQLAEIDGTGRQHLPGIGVVEQGGQQMQGARLRLAMPARQLARVPDGPAARMGKASPEP
jgi:hypothetical protein